MLYRALVQMANRQPDKVAIAGEVRSLTFHQLLCEVRATAKYLQSFGLKAEEAVFVGIPPSPDFYVFFYAACALGATVIPLLPSGKIPQITFELRPVLAVGDETFLKAARAGSSSLRATIDWNKSNGFGFSITNRYPFRRKKPIRGERILGILTSGTTGEPTLHFTSAEALLRHGELRARVLGMGSDDILLSTRPFNNLSSIDAPVILPIVCGCSVIVREKFQRFAAADIIARDRVSVVYGVPIIFEMLASIPRSHPGDFSSLRLCVSGGAPLPRFVYDKFYQRFGVGIRQRYGGTQFFPAFNFDTRGIPGTVGHISRPFPMTVISDDDRPVARGSIGEIVLDYAKLRDPFWRGCLKTNPDRRGRYIYTGDLGRVDTDGNLHIVGRKSPFIKVGGNRVAPAEIENVLRSNPKVRDSVVFAYHPGKHDEAVHAVVVPSDGLTRQELLAYCAERLDPHKCPRRLEFRKTLPRNAQGKIIRQRFQSTPSNWQGVDPTASEMANPERRRPSEK